MLRSDLCDFSDAYIVMKRNGVVDKKAITADDFNASHNTHANANATNTANNNVHKDLFACLFSIHNIIISLSCHEQVCLSGLRFERYFSHHRPR